MHDAYLIYLITAEEDLVLETDFAGRLGNYGLKVRSQLKSEGDEKQEAKRCAVVLLTEAAWHDEDVMKAVVYCKRRHNHVILIIYPQSQGFQPSRLALDIFTRGVHTIDATQLTEHQIFDELRRQIKLFAKQDTAQPNVGMSLTMNTRSALMLSCVILITVVIFTVLTFMHDAPYLTQQTKAHEQPAIEEDVPTTEELAALVEETTGEKPDLARIKKDNPKKKNAEKPGLAKSLKSLVDVNQKTMEGLAGQPTKTDVQGLASILGGSGSGGGDIDLDLGKLGDQLDVNAIRKLALLRKYLADEVSLDDMAALMGKVASGGTGQGLAGLPEFQINPLEKYGASSAYVAKDQKNQWIEPPVSMWLNRHLPQMYDLPMQQSTDKIHTVSELIEPVR